MTHMLWVLFRGDRLLSESLNNRLHTAGCDYTDQNIVLSADRHAVRAGHHLQSWKRDTICFLWLVLESRWVVTANLQVDVAGSCGYSLKMRPLADRTTWLEHITDAEIIRRKWNKSVFSFADLI